MIERCSEYIKKMLNGYYSILSVLIFTIFFNLFLYLRDIKIIFEISNISFTLKEVFIFIVFAFSFLSLIFLSLLVLLFLLDFINKLLSIKNKIFTNVLVLFFNFISILYVLLDLKSFKLLGVHLHDKIAIKAFNFNAMKNDVALDLKSIISELLIPVLIVLMAVALYLFIYFIIKRLNLQKKVKSKFYLMIYPIIFSIFLSIYFWSQMNLLSSLVPVWSFIKTGDMLDKIELRYDNDIKNVKLINKKNIVIVLSESFRQDVFNSENMPNMFKFIKDNNKNIIYPKHNFSASHFTLYSIFSLWYSVWSYNYRVFTSFTEYKESAAIKLFKKLGYKRLFLTTSHILEYDEAFKQVTEQFNVYKEFDTDEEMLLWFRNYYNKNLKTNDQPFIVFLFLYSSHYNYRYPKKFEKYLPVLNNKSKDLKKNTFEMSIKFKKELFNRYKNSVLYIDELFKEILLILDNKTLKDTVIAFTGDHGEQFWEHGLFGHASRVYTKETVEVPLIMYFPNLKEKIHVNLSSHVDLLPTILNYLTNITGEQIKKYFNGMSLLKKDKHEYIIVSSLEPIGGSDGKFCLLDENGKLVFKTTKLTNNLKFIPLLFTKLDDTSLNLLKEKDFLLKKLEKFEKEYFFYFFFKKK